MNYSFQTSSIFSTVINMVYKKQYTDLVFLENEQAFFLQLAQQVLSGVTEPRPGHEEIMRRMEWEPDFAGAYWIFSALLQQELYYQHCIKWN
jgi:hypothetical protein